MTDRYDRLGVSPDASLVEELRQRLHAELERNPLDDAAVRRRLTIAAPGRRRVRTNGGDAHVRGRSLIVNTRTVGAPRRSPRPRSSSSESARSRSRSTTRTPTTMTVHRRRRRRPLHRPHAAHHAPDGSASSPHAMSRSPTRCRTAGKRRTRGFLVAGEPSVVNFWDVHNVYADGCEWTLLDPRSARPSTTSRPCGPSARLHHDDTRRHHRGRVRRQAGRLHRPRLPDRGRPCPRKDRRLRPASSRRGRYGPRTSGPRSRGNRTDNGSSTSTEADS